jgi:hypothetical protein
MNAVGIAAAIEMTVCDLDTTDPISRRSASMSCGLTAMTTMPEPLTASAFESVVATR